MLQTTQIISDVCFITDHVAYASSNLTQNRLNRDRTLFFFFFLFFFYPGGCVSCLRACLGARFLPQSYQYSNLSLTASVDSCAEIKSAPSVAQLNLAEFGGRCLKVMLGVWEQCSQPKMGEGNSVSFPLSLASGVNFLIFSKERF